MEPRDGETGSPELRGRVEKVLSLLSPARGDSILMVGQREGLLARSLALKNGVDATWCEPAGPGPADEVVEVSTLESPVERLLVDCYHLPFEDGSFDSLVSQMEIEYLEDPALALGEWARTIKKGGKLVLATHNPSFRGYYLVPRPRPAHSFSLEQIRGLIEGAGLELGYQTTLFPNLWMPALCKLVLSHGHLFERLPYFRDRGMILILVASKKD